MEFGQRIIIMKELQIPKINFRSGDYITDANGRLLKVLKTSDCNKSILTNCGYVANHILIPLSKEVLLSCGFCFNQTESRYKVTIDDTIISLSVDSNFIVDDIQIYGPQYQIANHPCSQRGWCILSDLQDEVRNLCGKELPIKEDILENEIHKQVNLFGKL